MLNPFQVLIKALLCWLLQSRPKKIITQYKPTRYTLPINDPEVAEMLFRDYWDQDLLPKQEHVYVIYVNNENRLIKHMLLHIGGGDKCYIDKKLLFGYAHEHDATGFFLAHTHPKGSLVPSTNDKIITNEILLMSNKLGYRFLDHIIMTKKGYVSFTDERLLV